MFYEREMHNLTEKLSKLEGQLQMVVKEKNNLTSTAAAKEKEILELLHKQTMLKSNVIFVLLSSSFCTLL